MKKVVAIIPARFGSSRFPGKPLASIAGKTLIERAVASALDHPNISEVIVATDDQRILDHIPGSVMTSGNCASGSDRCAEVARNLDADIIVNIQGDWPCIEPHVIDAVIDALDDEDVVMGTAVVSVEDLSSPSLVKCVIDQKGRALHFSRAPMAGAYGHLGIYSYRPDFLQTYATLPATPLQEAESLEQLKALEHGFEIGVRVVDTLPLSVDTPEDIGRIEQYLAGQSTSSSPAGSSAP